MSDQAVPGKKIRRLPADQWNDMAAAARAFRESRLSLDSEGGGFDYPEPGFIKIRNDTGAALPRFSIVAIGTPWTTPSLGGATLDVFKTRRTCSASIPAEANRGKFAILVDGCAAGGVVDAIASGVVQCQINVDSGEEDYEWADIEPGSTSVLHAATSGSARILWKESGTGTKWAQVRLSNRVVATSAPKCYFYGFRLYRPTDGYRSAHDIQWNKIGSIYWINSIGDVAGCNLQVNTSSVTAYTDYAMKVTAAGWYEFDWRISGYEDIGNIDTGTGHGGYSEITTSTDGAQGTHTHPFTGSSVNTGTVGTHTHGLSALGPYTSDAGGSHNHNVTADGTVDAGGSFSGHSHTVQTPHGYWHSYALCSIKWRAAGGAEGDWDLVATASTGTYVLPSAVHYGSANGTPYHSAAPRGLLYLAEGTELVFRLHHLKRISDGDYNDLGYSFVQNQAYTNLTVTYHGTGLDTATHYP